MKDERLIALEVAHGDADSKSVVANVNFCESSASVTVGNLTVHIPWSELAQWQVWLAQRVENEA
jgi:hypothetical protein